MVRSGDEVQSGADAFVDLLLVCCDGIDGWTVVWTEGIEVEFESGPGGRVGEFERQRLVAVVDVLVNIVGACSERDL